MKHPSGKPIKVQDRRSWSGGYAYGRGFRLPHLRELHGDDKDRVNTYAVGFTAQFDDPDWYGLDDRTARKGWK